MREHLFEGGRVLGAFLATVASEAVAAPAWVTIGVGICTIIYTVWKTVAVIQDVLWKRRHHVKPRYERRHPRDTGHWGD